VLSFANDVQFLKIVMCIHCIAGSKTPTDEFEYDPTTGLRVSCLIVISTVSNYYRNKMSDEVSSTLCISDFQ